MKRFFTLFLALTLCINANFVQAEANGNDIIFTKITSLGGVSQNTVLSITQDDLGYIWMATFDGLNRYDGYDFVVYRHDESNPNSIGSNAIKKIHFDRNGNLWIGTDDGLSLYDREMDQFYNWETPEGFVTDMATISDSTILVGTTKRLRIFDYIHKRFIDNGLSENMANLSISTLSRFGDKVYIGTQNDGLFIYSIAEKSFFKITSYTSNKQINTIYQNPDASILIGTDGDGIYRLSPEGKIQNWKDFKTTSEGRICSNYVRAIETDATGRLWIGTYTGLNIYDNGRLETYVSDPFSVGSLSQNSVKCIYKDKQDGMWVGTYYGGINYWNPIKNKFRNIQHKQIDNSLNDNLISQIIEDSDGLIWIGTHSGGVNSYDPKKGIFKHYLLKKNNLQRDIESNDVKALLSDDTAGKLYIGVHAGGLDILDKKTGKVEHIRDENEAPSNVYSITWKDSKNLWVGSLEGLWTYNISQKAFNKVTKCNDGSPIEQQLIKALFIDSNENLWIGGDDGLSVYTKDKDGNLSLSPLMSKFKDIQSIHFIQYFFESSAKNIWICTRNGLYCYYPEQGNIRHWTKADGLPNNIIHGIEEDTNGRLWVSTEEGLSCFNPYSENFKNYAVNDGLQSNHFNSGAHLRAANGDMYFGGINGITVFSPESLKDNPFNPRPILTSLSVLDKIVIPGDDSGILEENISTARQIKLKQHHNYFTLGFSVPNYLAGRHNTFAYKLEGFDKEWHILNQTRKVSYSNLPHGSYNFMVKAANNDGIWNETPTTIEINVSPAWYQSTTAIIFFAICILTFIVLVVLFVIDTNVGNRLCLILAQKLVERHHGKMVIIPDTDEESHTKETSEPTSDDVKNTLEVKLHSPEEQEFLQKATAIVEKNINIAEFTTDDFAKELNMSRSNLHLKLKAITGESALDFIHKVRFERACKLLKEGKHSVAEISDMVGFSTPSYFATSFKKYMGCIPSEYVKNKAVKN